MSTDSEKRHGSFAKSLGLPYPLLADRDAAIARSYGVSRIGGWLPSKRVTFVIDRDGVVRKVIAAELDAAKHAREALAAVEALGASLS